MGLSLEPIALVRVVDGPWGPVHVAATERGIVAAESLTTTEAFNASLIRRLRGLVVPEEAVRPDDTRRDFLDRAEAVVAAFVARRPPDDPVPVDLTDRPRWDQVVLAAVREIGWGRTASYGQIARMVGAPRAARAVGGALGRNPITLLIPCHRIIAADGSIGGYGADAWGSRSDALERKQTLLAREGVPVAVRDG